MPGCDDLDLTVDHVTAGSLEGGVQVLCRSHNAAKGSRNLTLEQLAEL